MEAESYKIGEAANMIGVKPYVLRFWETEFPEIAPRRSESGQRRYAPDQINLIRRIKTLLYDEGLTIEGARRRLAEGEKLSRTVAMVRTELLAIRKLVE